MTALKDWRGPLWLKRLRFRYFPGRWTQAEVDDIHRRAHERYESLRSYIDPAPALPGERADEEGQT